MRKERIFACPTCKRGMIVLEQNNGGQILKCLKCHWAISIWHWFVPFLARFINAETGEIINT